MASPYVGYDKNKPLKSNRGGNIIWHEEHLYLRRYVSNTGSVWQCRKRPCAGKISMLNNGQISIKTLHSENFNCMVTEEAYILENAANQIVTNATTMSNGEAYSGMVVSLTNSTVSSPSFVSERCIDQLPSKLNMSSSMARERSLNLPPRPIDTKSIIIPQCFLNTIDGAPFILHMFEPNEVLVYKRIIVFSTTAFFFRLCNSDRIHIDGTFFCCSLCLSH